MAGSGYDDDAGRQPPAPTLGPAPADGGRVSGVVALAPALALPRHDADGVVLDDGPPDPPSNLVPHSSQRANVAFCVRHMVRHPQFRDVLRWDDERDQLVFATRPPWSEHDRPGRAFEPGQPVSIDDYARGCGWFERTSGRDVPEPIAARTMRIVGQRTPVRPMRDWLLSLPEWDGVPRLDSWMADVLGCEPGPYATELGRRWMMGVAERLVSPGARAGRTLAIVDDGKGVDVMRALCPSPDRFLEADTNTTAAHDLVATARGALLAYVAVDGTSRSITRALALAGRGSDAYRPNYEEGGVRQARCHTTVVALYEVDALDDERLSRGCLPILCAVGPGGAIAAAAARDMMLAEARDRLARGELPALDDPDLAELSALRSFGDSEWSEYLPRISEWLYVNRNGWALPSGTGYVTIPGLVRSALAIPVERASRSLSIKIGRVLMSLGFRRGGERLPRRITQDIPGASAQIFPWYPSEAAAAAIAADRGGAAATNGDVSQDATDTTVTDVGGGV